MIEFEKKKIHSIISSTFSHTFIIISKRKKEKERQKISFFLSSQWYWRVGITAEAQNQNLEEEENTDEKKETKKKILLFFLSFFYLP